MSLRLSHTLLALTVFTAGCGILQPSANQLVSKPAIAPTGTTIAYAVMKDSGMNGDRTATVELATPVSAGFATQAIVHKWVREDIFQYDVTLKVFDADTNGYVDFSPALVVSVRQKDAGGGLNQAVFTGLSHGKKYRASIVARGNNGGTAADTVLNANTDTHVDYDFTAYQDVEDTLTQHAKITFDAVAFNGTANTVITGPDDGTYSNPTGNPTTSTGRSFVATLTASVNYGAWGWDIVGMGYSNLDMSPIRCSDGQLHAPNFVLVEASDGRTFNYGRYDVNDTVSHGVTLRSGVIEWWMYAGQWNPKNIHEVRVRTRFDGGAVTGLGSVQATASI